MSGANNDVKLSLTVYLNQERNKVLYAESDNDFVDILLSFLTLPLGRIARILKNHFKDDEIPTIGSLSSLYRSLENLDSAHFVTEAAKEILLNPTASFEAEYERLKLDITDSPPAVYFCCRKCNGVRFRSMSLYYDKLDLCFICHGLIEKEVVEKRSVAAAASSDGVFTKQKASFLISNDLNILPKESGFLQIINNLGIKNMDKVEAMRVTIGFNEVMKLLKASLTSPTPLSDVILNKTTHMNYSTIVESPSKEDCHSPNYWFFNLKAIVQTTTRKILYAQTKEDFVGFLSSLLFVPLGGVEHLQAGKTCLKPIKNLYRSTSNLIDDEYFKTPDVKTRLMRPTLPHGSKYKAHILPLAEEWVPNMYSNVSLFSSTKFPKGQGSYLEGPQSYQVKDDLSVEPYCFVSIVSSLGEQGIHISDVEEVELKIGPKEVLSILKASLTSTSVLTDALLPHKPNKQPKREFI